MKQVLLIALPLVLLSAQAGPQTGDYIMENGQPCPLAGTAKGPAFRELNRHKNRFLAPAEDQIDPLVTLAAMLAPGDDHNRFNQEKGATITGFVYDVIIPTQGETCNCGATAQVDEDTHIEVALGPNPKLSQLVIVEVTPRLRKQMKDMGKDWSSERLRDPVKGIKGKWVEFTGWLLFDFIHTNGAENTTHGGQDVWRATCWELHPVTSIRVLDGPPTNVPILEPDVLDRLQKAHAQHVRQSPRARQEIDRRLKADLEPLLPEERQEAENERAARRATHR